MSQLRDLLVAARKNGWAVGVASLDALRYQARWMSMESLSSRKGRQDVEVLRPIEPEQAPKRSLSATYGRGAQPLHTDGAHMADPPEIVVLAAEAPSPVQTVLSRLDYWGSTGRLRDTLAHGLFTVDDGRGQFLAPAYAGGRIRYDPGCMAPADSRARSVVDHFSNALESATPVEWSGEHQVLVIDNRTVLHARANAEGDPNRALQRLMLRIQKGEGT